MPRFVKGGPPGPGRPPGSRNKLTQFLGDLATHRVLKIWQVVADEAEGGDMRAASLIISRTHPIRDRSVVLDLPKIESSGDIVHAQAALIAAMARGEITPGEAASIANVLETQRRAIETHDHEVRIRALAEKQASRQGSGRSDGPAEATAFAWEPQP
jgi:hypothetical protein